MNLNTTNQREDEILREILSAGGSCRVSFLAKQLGVSLETIRRNVRNMEKREIVRKVHGGVHILEDILEPALSTRLNKEVDAKERLGKAVANMISEGDSLFLDIGSTTAYVASALKHHHNLFVVTNSVFVAHTLASQNNNKVFMAGGELRPHDGGAFGTEAQDLIKRLNVRFAILSVGAVNAEFGFMLHDLQEANLARLAMDHSQIPVVVADGEKLDKRAPVSLVDSRDINVFVTDQQPSNEIMEFLSLNEIDLVLAE